MNFGVLSARMLKIPDTMMKFPKVSRNSSPTSMNKISYNAQNEELLRKRKEMMSMYKSKKRTLIITVLIL